MQTDALDPEAVWLSDAEIASVRDRVPLVYVEAVPVRVDHLGRVERIGLLLGLTSDDTISRAIVSGRVLFGETIREALWRHLAKDLGPDADPQIPTSPTPFTVVEYFPDEERTGFHDPRQHAVSLAYVVPVTGECQPAQDALEFTWMTVADAHSDAVAREMTGGQDRLLRLALAHCQARL